ncbi:uncharacterized protein [Setaria viridis]|uniref:Uncharacterized protein n=1 Tax=Setaria viridis TaxID=4556 RepID=A0A4V6D1K5_SETVI|nr:uncharacterized protein LOC117838856 isoform X2 [Setaria viridis]TKV95015.1 hypothetical protein SEVIR_9G334400v2 [Setaria viridis]
MTALVDLDLNCRPSSPEPAVAEETRRAMLRQEQSFPDQMNDPHKFYGSFWKQSSSAQSSLHSTHEHKMNLGSWANQNQEDFTNSDKHKSPSNIAQQNSDVRASIWRKTYAYNGVIDLEKPCTSGDAVGDVGCSGFGNLSNQNGRSRDGSCCISPENSSLVESAQLCRAWNSSRLSPGSVGSSDTPDCQSPIKKSETESRHSLIDLNVPQEESLPVSSALFHSSSTYPGKTSKSPTEVSEAECGSGIGSMRGSSITVITPNSVADSSRDVVAESSVQRKGLFDLNVSLESIDMPSEIISGYRDKVVNNDVSKGTASNHSFSRKNSLQAETSSKYLVHGNDHMLASKDDNNVLLPTSTNNGINKAQMPESGIVNKELLIPESPLADNNVPRLSISHNRASNLQEVSMLQAKAHDDDTTASIAARTLLSIFQHNSADTAYCPGSSSQTAAQNGNNEPQPSLDSFEKIVLSLDEIKDDGQSVYLAPSDKEGPACGIKLKRGRGMRNFQREIMPGLVSLARQEICEDLEAIGYEPKKTRSRKTRKRQGASSTRSRPRKRGSAARN